MAYFAPYIDETGIHIPTYSDVRDNLIEQYKGIYGQDLYLENDSQDYQMLSALASSINDANQVSVLAYNNNSPAFAIGAGLARNVALNGIAPKGASCSTAIVTLNGSAGTVINNGIVADINGVYWDLPPQVIITQDGTTNVTATCRLPGAITANALEINQISTPTRGWLSVSNAAPATVGRNIETDPQLRIRQRISTAKPSLTVFEGTLGAVAECQGVTRYIGYENDTNEEVDTLPPHSITVVAEGGENADIANAIYLHKSIGCYTNGTTEYNIALTDGAVVTIRFYRPDYIAIEVQLTLKKLQGYTSALADLVKQNIVDYINSFAIGADVEVPNLYQPIYASLPDAKNPAFACTALTANITGESPAAALVIGMFEVAQLTADDITITEV